MTAEFSVEAVTHALRGAAVASVEVVDTFPASSAKVARLRVAFQDGREPLIVIGKSASGAALSSARRELRFFEQIAPLWASHAPELLGSWEEERGEDACLLLLIEDLETSGYALAREGLSLTQLEGVADTLVSLHSRFWEDLQGSRRLLHRLLQLAHQLAHQLVLGRRSRRRLGLTVVAPVRRLDRPARGDRREAASDGESDGERISNRK